MSLDPNQGLLHGTVLSKGSAALPKGSAALSVSALHSENGCAITLIPLWDPLEDYDDLPYPEQDKGETD